MTARGTSTRVVLAALWAAVSVGALVPRLGAVAGAPHPAVAALLLLAEAALLLAAGGFIGTLLAGSVVRPAPALPLAPRGAAPPAIDILIPTLDEPLPLLRRTLRRALAARLPHETYLLDDGGRPAVRALCEELGARYVSRPDAGRGYKAGNLNAGLRASRGDLVLVIDADALVRPGILERLAGAFAADPRLGFVQCPQVFYNVDALDSDYDAGRREWWSATEIFQLHMQRGFAAAGAAICVGSGFMARRSAIEAAGGFDEGRTSEDVHFGVQVQRAGYRSRFHEEALLYHLAPDGLGQDWRQRVRWVRGDLELLRELARPGGLRPVERLILARHALAPVVEVFRGALRCVPPVVALAGARVYDPRVAFGPGAAILAVAAYASAFLLPGLLTAGRARMFVSRSFAHHRVGHALAALLALALARLGPRRRMTWSTPKGAGTPAPLVAYAAPLVACALGLAGTLAAAARVEMDLLRGRPLSTTWAIAGALSLELGATGALALRIARGRRVAADVDSVPVRRPARFEPPGGGAAVALEVIRLGPDVAWATGPRDLAPGRGTIEIDLADGGHRGAARLAPAPGRVEPALGPGIACWRLDLELDGAARDRLADAIDDVELPRLFASLATPPYALAPGDPTGDPRGIPLYATREGFPGVRF